MRGGLVTKHRHPRIAPCARARAWLHPGYGSSRRGVGELLYFLQVRDGGFGAGGLGEEVERFLVVLAARRERLIHVLVAIWVALDLALEPEPPPDGRDQFRIVGDQRPDGFPIDGEHRFRR